MYRKPVLKEEKIKISFFLNIFSSIDNFNIIGNVYAQSDANIGMPAGNGDPGTGTGDPNPGM